MSVRTVADLDKLVNSRRNIKDSKERDGRNFHIAQEYVRFGEFEKAKRALFSYMTVNENCCKAHSLLGDIHVSTGNVEAALQSYQRAHAIDGSQKDFILKICKLYVQGQGKLDVERSKHWLKVAEEIFPGNAIVFELRDAIFSVTTEGLTSEQREKLIRMELIVRPSDMALRLKLLNLILEQDRIVDAYKEVLLTFKQCCKFGFDSEQVGEEAWYIAAIDVFKTYKDKSAILIDAEFYLNWLSILDQLIFIQFRTSASETLPLSNRTTDEKSNPIRNSLTLFDRVLAEALKITEPKQGQWQEFLGFIQGQFYFHLATLALIKQSMSKTIDASILYLSAYSLKPLEKVSGWYAKLSPERKRECDEWHSRSCLRTSQSGHVLMALVSSAAAKQQIKDELRKGRQCVDRIYASLIGTSTISGTSQDKASYLLSSKTVVELQMNFPDATSLTTYDQASHDYVAGRLSSLVWYALRQYTRHHSDATVLETPQPDYGFRFLTNLPFGPADASREEAESLSQLDLHAFLYCTVYCCVSNGMDKRTRLVDGSLVAPVHVSPHQSMSAQDEWWKAAFTLGPNNLVVNKNVGLLRRSLSRGIRELRACAAASTLNTGLLVHLARTFALRSQDSKLQNDDTRCAETVAFENAAARYWKAALRDLEHQLAGAAPNCLGTPSSGNRAVMAKVGTLFPCEDVRLTEEKIAELAEEGKLFLACFHKDGYRYDEAEKYFEQVQSPIGSYYHAIMLKSTVNNPVVLSSHSLSKRARDPQQRATLSRARHLLGLTLDRLDGNDTHPLYDVINTEIDDIDTQLAGTDRALNRSRLSSTMSNGVDNHSESEYTDKTPDDEEHFREIACTPRASHARSGNGGYTPHGARQYHNRTIRPSPERLQSEIRSVAANQSAIIASIVDHNRALIDVNKSLVEELRAGRLVIEQLRDELTEMRSEMRQSQMERTQRSAARTALEGEEYGGDDYYEGYYEDHDDTKYQSAVEVQNSRYTYVAPHLQEQQQAAAAASAYLGYVAPAVDFSLPSQTHGVKIPAVPVLPAIAPGFFSVAAYAAEPTVGGSHLAAALASSGTIVSSTPRVERPGSSGALQPAQFNSILSPVVDKVKEPVVHSFQISLPSVTTGGKIDVSPVAASAAELKPGVARIPYQPLTEEIENDEDRANVEAERNISFDPVIPLPEKVEVRTGEEDEEVLFEANAKLFRFDNSEWKERGVGVVKLLYLRSDNRVRLLMRRDQVLKICANHYLTPDMVLLRPATSDKAWTWAAQDFADEQVKLETLCIRLKTPELAQAFYDKFEEAKKIMSMGTSVVKKEIGSTAAASSASIDMTKFLPKFGSWNCTECLVNNLANQVMCAACQSVKPGAVCSPQTKSGFGFMPDLTPVDGNSLSQKLSSAPAAPTAPAATFVFGAAKLGSTPVTTAGHVFGSPMSSVSRPTFDNSASSSASSISSVSTGSAGTTSFGGFSFTGTPTVKPVSGDVDKKVEEVKPAAPSNVFSGFKFGSTTPIVKPSLFGGAVPVAKPTFAIGETVVGGGPAVISSLSSASSADKKSRTPSPTPFSNVFGGKAVLSSLSSENGAAKSFVAASPATAFNVKADVTTPVPAKTVGEESAPSYLFGKVTEMTFDSLVQSASKPDAFQAKADFKGFAGAGQALFATTATSPEEKLGAATAANESSEQVEDGEYEPSAMFEPVVPLPSLIKVTTGEEDEDKLFSDRARLYRYDDGTKQWKERGVGEIKLLQNKKTKRIRLLMRREQVHKICANHYLTREMDLQPMTSSDRSWVYYAQDFSDGTLSHDKLAVKFKSPIEAEAFKKAFLDAQSKIPDLNESSLSFQDAQDASSPDVSVVLSTDQRPLSERFKPAEGSWACSVCFIRNDEGRSSCAACESPKAGVTSSDAGTPKQPSFFTVTSSVEGIASTSSSGFNFGLPAAAPCSTAFSFGNAAGGFSFLSGSKSDTTSVTLSLVSSAEHASAEGEDDGEGNDDEVVDSSSGDRLVFEPVIPLPDKIDVVTGEEEWTVVFNQRAKLFRRVEIKEVKEWKERGIGDLKLLRHPDTGKYRLVMRRDHIHKVCVNHYVTSQLTVAPMLSEPKAYTWVAIDYSEAQEGQSENFCARFKTSEIAEQFKETVELAANAAPVGDVLANSTQEHEEIDKNLNAVADKPKLNFSFKITDSQSETETTPSLGFSFGNKFGSTTCISNSGHSLFGGATNRPSIMSDDDIVVVYDACSELDQDLVRKALELQLPAGYYQYMKKPGCPGCRGCYLDTDIEE